jgi:hypothetical protein
VVRGFGFETARASVMAVLLGWAARPEWGGAAGTDLSEAWAMAVGMGLVSGLKGLFGIEAVVVVGMAVLL